MKFSVCMSVYRNDKPMDFRVAINSVLQQTLIPDEIVLVIDGPIPNTLEAIIDELENNGRIKIIRLPNNGGHAVARQTGINNASYDLVAIMDSDDVADSKRFEKQVRCFENDRTLSVLGGQIHEFVDSVKHIVGIREVPLEDVEIKRYLKSRCPMNQVTVMMKKKDVLAVGGYLPWYCNEDYYLWIRMCLAGYKFKNLPDNLVNVRVGKDMYQRRGGWQYFKSESALQYFMLQNNVIGFSRYLFNVYIRFVVQVLMPNRVRSFVFQKLFRKSKK